jgi:outer membrane autotransporter protein
VVVAPQNATIFPEMATVAIFNADHAISDLLGHASAPLPVSGAPQLAMNTVSNPYGGAAGGTQLAELGAIIPQVLGSFGAWLDASGSFAQVHADNGAPGYHAQTGGFLAGLSGPVNPALTLGVAVGYDHFSLTEDAPSHSSGTDDAGRFAVYGAYVMPELTLSATAGGAYDSVSTTRPLPVGTAKESHGGLEANAGLEVSRVLDFAGFQLVPQAGLSYVNFSENSFLESGAGGADLAGFSHKNSSLQPFIGVAATGTWATGAWTITPDFHVTYSHEALSTDRSLTVAALDGTTFGVSGVRAPRNVVDTGASISAQAAPDVDVYAGYDIAIGLGVSTSQSVSAGVSYRF